MVRLKLAALGCWLLVMFSTINPVWSQQNWTRFRGDDGAGLGAEGDGLPDRWDRENNVAWVAEVPGNGWSCPIVWGDRVFVTSVVSDEPNLEPKKGLYLGRGVRTPGKGTHHWWVYCFELKSGRLLWQRQATEGRPTVPRHPKSSYAAETATTDGRRLYVLFGDVGLFCYDLDGDLKWKREIVAQKTLSDYGAAASPVVHEGKVIVVYDNFGESWIAAFDSDTGRPIWKLNREETHSWATPLIWQHDLRTEIVVPGKNKNRGYSMDGKLLWQFDGRMSNLVIPSPFVVDGLCYLASGYVGDAHRPTFALGPGAEGDFLTGVDDFASSPFIHWYQPTASAYNTSQVVYQGLLYTVYDQGFITCHDAKTGELVYGKQRFSPAGSFTASPWAYDGKVFCLNEDGLTYVVEAGPTYRLLGTNDLKELSLATPAISQGRLLIRTKSHLYCVGDK